MYAPIRGFHFGHYGDRAPAIVLPISNYDNNRHAADENIRLGDFFYGVEAIAAALMMK